MEAESELDRAVPVGSSKSTAVHEGPIITEYVTRCINRGGESAIHDAIHMHLLAPPMWTNGRPELFYRRLEGDGVSESIDVVALIGIARHRGVMGRRCRSTDRHQQPPKLIRP